ncbi:MAG: energy transducer TonB [Bacteroidota bacterium]
MKYSILKVVIVSLGIFFSCTVQAQEDSDPKMNNQKQHNMSQDAPPPPPPPPAQDPIFKVVEQMPRFPGCEGKELSKKELDQCADNRMAMYMYKRMKYPALARENGTQGTVIISFVVGKNGSIMNPEIQRDLGDGCGEEALKVVKRMQDEVRWIPGKQRGRPVKVKVTIPVKFKL